MHLCPDELSAAIAAQPFLAHTCDLALVFCRRVKLALAIMWRGHR